MVTPPSPVAPPSLVARLRAAGCVFAEDEARLLVSTARSAEDLAVLVDRRVAGLPLEHVVGWAEFCEMRILLDPGVFVPRRRTELLARHAVLAASPGAVVVDLCCGSGAVGAVVAAAVDRVELHAVDIDPVAVQCARRNVATFGGQVYDGDLVAPLPTTLRGRVDVMVANAPYVPTGGIRLLPPEAREQEPLAALDGGADGLDVLRRIVGEARAWLAPRGHLLVECSAAQAVQLVVEARAVGLAPRVVHSDENHGTVVVATPPTINEPGCS